MSQRISSSNARESRTGIAPSFSTTVFCWGLLREAARSIYEADRHAKKELTKRVRGVRGIERQVEARTDPEAEVVRGYCSAVRSVRTDDGRPPLEASGLKLHRRLTAIDASLERAAEKGEGRPNCGGCTD